jgi:drug/metabolite transporter (DMT)-like permease
MDASVTDRNSAEAGKAAAMLFLATLVWSASFLAMKALAQVQQSALPGAGSWFLSSLSLLIRFGLSALLLWLWNGRKVWDISRLEIWQGTGLGLFCALGLLLQMDGVLYTLASTSAFLTQCYCIFIPLTLALHRRQAPSRKLAFACLMVMCGVAVLAGINWRHFKLGRGEAETIAASLVFTGQILWLERPLFASNRSALSTQVMFAVVALVVLPVAWRSGGGPRHWALAYHSWVALMLVGFLALGCTLAAYGIMNRWQPHVPATEAGLIYCSEPVFTSVLALFLPGWLSRLPGISYADERLLPRLLIGGGLITTANVLVLWRPAPRKNQSP